MVYALDISNKNVNPIAQFGDLASILNLVRPILIGAVGIVALIYSLIGGFYMITAGGDSEKFKKAQQIFKNVIVGTIIVILSYLIIKLIEMVFGINFPL